MMRLAILVTVVLSGCSFVLVSGPPSNHQQLPVFDCTTSRLGPGLDTVWTVLQVINLAAAVGSSSEAEWDDRFGGEAPISRSASIPLYTAFAALGAAGMYYGFSRTSRCKDAKSELATRSQGGGGYPMQPGPGTWPPPGGAPPPGGSYPQAPAPTDAPAPQPAPTTP